MSWRHPDSTITDPKPSAGSYSQADVRRLSAFIVKLRDMPEGVLVLSSLSRVWNNRTHDPILRYSSGNESEDDDDACYEILIITLICSAATILARGNQGGGYVPFVVEGPSNRGKSYPR
nr:hypothetical protein [Tanacetum cinerariifolium]